MPSIGEMMGAATGGMSMPNLASALAPVTEFATGFAVAIKKGIAPFEKIVDIASSFVSALDPALVEDLGRKFRDLNAVIGVALRPIVDVAREIVKNLSDHMLPIMKKLEPIVDKISRAIQDGLNQAIEDMALFLEGMLPTMNKMSDAAVVLIGILQDVYEVFNIMMRTISALIGNEFNELAGGTRSVKEIMESLRNTVREVITNFMMLAARLMMAMGWFKSLETFVRRGLKTDEGQAKKDESGGLAVAMNAAFKSIGDLSKSVQLEAFRASAQDTKAKNPAEKSNDLLEGIRKQIFDMMSKGDSREGDILEAVQAVKNMRDWLIEMVPTSEAVREWMTANKERLREMLAKLEIMAGKAEKVFNNIETFSEGVVNTSNAIGNAAEKARIFGRALALGPAGALAAGGL